MEVTYRRNLYKSYMCIKTQAAVQEQYELCMLEKQRIPGLLSMQPAMADGVQSYLYEISGKQQVEDYLSGKGMDYGMLQRLLFAIQDLCRVLPDYLLREEGLCLEFPLIYVNLEDGSLYFTYLPFKEKNLPEAFKGFMEQVLRKINHQDWKAAGLAYQVYQMCSMENASIGQMLEASLGKREDCAWPGVQREGQEKREIPEGVFSEFQRADHERIAKSKANWQSTEKKLAKGSQADIVKEEIGTWRKERSGKWGKERNGKWGKERQGKWRERKLDRWGAEKGSQKYIEKVGIGRWGRGENAEREKSDRWVGEEAERGKWKKDFWRKLEWLPTSLKESFLFSNIWMKKKSEQEEAPRKGRSENSYEYGELVFEESFLDKQESEKKSKVSAGSLWEKGILGSKILESPARNQVQEISREYFQKQEHEAESERVKARGILKEYLPDEKDSFTKEKKILERGQEQEKEARGNLITPEVLNECQIKGQEPPAGYPNKGQEPPAGCQNNGREDVKKKSAPERPKGYILGEEQRKKLESVLSQERPKEYLQKNALEKKADAPRIRGIPSEYLIEEDSRWGVQDLSAHGTHKDYLQEENFPKEAPDIHSGLGKRQIRETVQEAGITQDKAILRWPRKKKKGAAVADASFSGNKEEAGSAEESARFATEILADYGQRPEGILVYQGRHGCEDIYIDREEFFLGKNKQQANGIINARGISRLHARIIREEDTYYIEDLNSTNGTYLNETPLEYHQKMELCKDDHIRFGREEYVFC